jgi:hypothetical protein
MDQLLIISTFIHTLWYISGLVVSEGVLRVEDIINNLVYTLKCLYFVTDVAETMF